MRILPAALVISAGLHTGAIAWVRTQHAPDPQAARAVTPAVTVVDVESQPMAVALLDDHSVRVAPDTVPRGNAGINPAHPHAISTGHTAPPMIETHTPPPAHSKLLEMRHPEIRSGVTDDYVAHFLDNTKPLAPKAIDGERIADDVARGEQRLHDPRWVQNATPDQVTAERYALAAHRAEADGHELQPDGTGYKATHETFVAHVEADGTAHFTDEPNVKRHGLGLTFDVNDALMRNHGQDPYASNKRRFLDQTRDERYEIGKVYKHHQLAQSAALMQKNVDYLWAKKSDLAARKQGLFDLWDECAETGDADVVDGGRAARELVVGIIRARLTGASAYTPDELATLNAHRHAKSTFAPYD